MRYGLAFAARRGFAPARRDVFRSCENRAAALPGNSVIASRYFRLESAIRESLWSASASPVLSAVNSLAADCVNFVALSTQPLQNSMPAFSVATWTFAVSIITARISLVRLLRTASLLYAVSGGVLVIC